MYLWQGELSVLLYKIRTSPTPLPPIDLDIKETRQTLAILLSYQNQVSHLTTRRVVYGDG